MLSIPSYFSFAIFGNVTDFDCNKTSGTIYVVIYSPNGSELFKSKEMKLPNFDEQRVGLKFSFDFRNFTFDSCGEYQVKLFVYDKCIAETQFTVEKRSE